jgi:hypothetical protein
VLELAAGRGPPGSPAVDSPALAALELRDFIDHAVTQALLHRCATRHRGNDRVRWPHGMGGSAGVGILLVASIESQLLGVISLGALAIFTGRSTTILSTGFGAALATRPLRSSLTAVAPGLGVASFAFAIWYAAAAWTLAPYFVFVAHPAVKAR